MRARVLVVCAVLGAIAGAVVVGLGSPGGASPPDRSRGSAQAVFQAGGTGGITILIRTPGLGVPRGQRETGDPEAVRINPLARNFQYCASGWHLISLNVGDGAEFYDDKQALFDSLASVDVTFRLDGVQLTTERTAIKRNPVDLSDEDAYWVGVGTLVPPGTLTVGSHSLTTAVVHPIFGTDEFSVQFNVLSC
jgi:hypothetical protein